MKRIIWGFFSVFTLLCCLFSMKTYAMNGETTEETKEETEVQELSRALYAKSAVLLDASSGRVLFGKNESEPMAMASTTKIMTCILTLENIDLDEEVIVSDYAAGMPKVKLNMRRGERYKVRDLLYSLMLESHNDSVVALAEAIGRRMLAMEQEKSPTEKISQEESKAAVAAFARMMNEKAAKIGCEDTWFITPNGLDAIQELWLFGEQRITKRHATTAKELAMIMAYCVLQSEKREEFLEITQTKNYSFHANNRSFSLVNHNALFQMMEGVLSGKTGFTNQAGYCYVGALENENRTYIVALLACGWPNHKNYKWSDARKLLQYGIENFYYQSFDEAKKRYVEPNLQPVMVLKGQTKKIDEQAYVEIKLHESKDDWNNEAPQGALMKKNEVVNVTLDMKENLVAPVAEGLEVGRVKYQIGNETFREDVYVTGHPVRRIDYIWCLYRVLELFLIKK